MPNLDHIDPGNSGGSIEIPVSPYKYVHRQVAYKCPICGELFDEEDIRRSHKATYHPVKRPFLYIQGQSPSNKNVVVREKLEVGDIRIEDADTIWVDDDCFEGDLDSAIGMILDKQSGACTLVLSSHGYKVEYRLNFDIADATVLAEVESIFYAAFSNEMPLARKLQLFSEKSEKLAHGKSYAGGLGCYVTAIMAKDQLVEAAITQELYLKKLGEAQDKLDGFSRPLASSISSLSAFMTNNFTESIGDVNLPTLQDAKKFFRSGEFPTISTNLTQNSVVPIDNMSGVVIDFIVANAGYRKAKESDLEKYSKAPQVTPHDKEKFKFLLWAAARESGQVHRELQLKRQLTHSGCFGEIIAQFEGRSK
jgi:hypothetical protein